MIYLKPGVLMLHFVCYLKYLNIMIDWIKVLGLISR